MMVMEHYILEMDGAIAVPIIEGEIDERRL
jgi:hypothetical protein